MKYELVSKRFRLALSKLGMSQQELSEKSGVGKASISQYVNGTHAPGNISAGKMGKVLEVSAEWLMGLDVEMRKEISTKGADIDMEFVKKISLLNERDKKLVMSMIDSMLSIKEGGAN